VFIPPYVEADYTNIESVRKMHVGLSEVNKQRELNYSSNSLMLPINYGYIEHFHKAVKYCLWTGYSWIPKIIEVNLKDQNRKLILFFIFQGILLGIAEVTGRFNIDKSFGLWENIWFGYFNLKWLFLCK